MWLSLFLHRTGQNAIEPIIINDAVYNGCGATRQIPTSKSLVLFYDFLFETKFKRICNGRFIASSVDSYSVG